MTLPQALFQLLIGPLELVFDVVYIIARELSGSGWISIFALSITVNLMLLPLYRRADAIQEAERAREAALAPWVSHIKKTFTGDERFMMLRTYYRQNRYKPFHALKGSLPLLLEISDRIPELKGKLRLLPYSALGGGGLLPVFRPDYLQIDGKKEQVLVGLSPRAAGEDFDALL